MTWVAVGIGGASTIMGGISAISGGKQKKKIAKAIADLPENKLTNIADGMQVSTRGADLQKQEQGRLAATQVGALADGGSRALIGGIGQVSASNQRMNEQIGANLDEQQNNITNVRAQDEGRIQSAKEQRANAKLAALSGQYAAAQDTQAQGMGNMIQGVGMAGGALAGMEKSPKAPKVKKTK
jgi:hypothetical protein